MSKLKILSSLILAACIIAGLALPPVRGGREGQLRKPLIRGLRVSVKGNRTCLIFDAGARGRNGSVPLRRRNFGFLLQHGCQNLPDKLSNDKTAAKEVKFRRGSDFLEVLFRGKNITVSYKLRTGKAGDTL